MGSTVTLVRLANRLSTTTKALSVCSAARPTTLSSQGTDRSFRPACAAASNRIGKEAGRLPTLYRRVQRRFGKAPTPAADDRAQPSAPSPPSAAVVPSQAIARLANPHSLPLISYPFCFYSMFYMLGAYARPLSVFTRFLYIAFYGICKICQIRQTDRFAQSTHRTPSRRTLRKPF